MPKKTVKLEADLKNFDWIVLGRHPSSILSGCLAAKLGAKVLFLPQVGQNLKTPHDKVSADLGFDYESAWIGGFSNPKNPEEQGLLDLCLNRLDPLLVQKWFIHEDRQTLLLTRKSRILSENFLSDWIHQFESQKSKKAQQAKIKVWSENEREMIQVMNRIPSLFHTDVPLRKNQSNEYLARIRAFFETMIALSFSNSIGKRLEKRWFLKVKSLFPRIMNRNREREKWEVLTARYAESSGVLLGVEELSQSGKSDWACFYASRLRRLKTNLDDWVDDLLRTAQTQGALIDETAQLDSILFQSNCFRGIEYVSSNQDNEDKKIQVSSHGLVCGTPAVFLENFLKVKKKKNETSSKKLSFKVTEKMRMKKNLKGWNFSWSFSASPNSWERSLPRRLIWSEIGSPPIEWEWDWLTQKGEDEKAILRVRTLLPWSQESLQFDYLSKTLRNIESQACRLFPGIEFSNFKLKHSSDEKAEKYNTEGEALLKALYPWKDLESIPENLKVYFGSGTGVDSGIEGLFLSNEMTYPSLGSFAWPLAALESSAWLAHRLGMSGPFMDLGAKSKIVLNSDQRRMQK